jgi:hypothetical protein
MIDQDRLDFLESELIEPDAELRDLTARLAGAYKTRGGRMVIDLSDHAAIERRAEIRELMNANRFAHGKLRSERDRLRAQARAEARDEQRQAAPKQGRAA